MKPSEHFHRFLLRFPPKILLLILIF